MGKKLGNSFEIYVEFCQLGSSLWQEAQQTWL